MGFLTRLRVTSGGPDSSAVTRSFATGDNSSNFLPSLGASQAATGVYVSQSTAMSVSAVYACTRIRARDVARCTPHLSRTNADGMKQAVVDHALARLFVKPNLLQTWYEFCEQMGTAYLLRGNAYAVKLRNRRGEVGQLIPVNPDLVQVMESFDGQIFYQVSRQGLWMMSVLDNEPIVIPAEDVFHLKDLSFDSLMGVGRLAFAREAIGLGMAQEQQAARYIGHGARPSGILQTDRKLGPEMATRLKANWEALQSGVQNAGKTAVLEEGLKWSQMQLTSVDLEFLNSRLFQIKEICRFFDMPPHKIGEMENIGRTTMAEANADYVQSTVMSDLKRWEDRIALDFALGDEGIEVNFDESELLRGDVKYMMDIARLGVLSGLLSQNEGREFVGRGPKTGKETGPDALQLPVNLAPNGSAIDGTAPDNAGRPPAGQEPKP